MPETFKLVQMNLCKSFNTQKKSRLVQSREQTCHVEDWVWKRDHMLSSAAKEVAAKLAPKYSGPYTVTKVLFPVVFYLKHESSGQLLKTIHIKDLNPAY